MIGKTRHLITLLLLSTILLIQNTQSVTVSSQLQGEPLNTTGRPSSTNPTTTASAFNQTVEPLQSANWTTVMLHLQAPRTGCFMATYPNTMWQPTKCGTAPLLQLRPQPSTGSQPSTVGNGIDEVAQSPGTLIGSSVGSFQFINGLSSETDSLFGPNEFGLQINSQFFPGVSTTYTDHKSGYAYSWEQFVFINDPHGTYGTQIFIQYWLINYHATYGSCPSTPPPGGNGWFVSSGNCYANSPSVPVAPSQPATNLANLILKGYANLASNDENVFCITGGNCYIMAITDQVLNLYQYWMDAEFNVFGMGNGSQANFNSGTSITITNTLQDQSGNVIVPSCVNTGYTAETNNLYLGSCSSNSNGQIVFTESNLIPPNPVIFLMNPSGGGTIQLQAPGTTYVGGTSGTAEESNNILSGQFSFPGDMPVIMTQLGVYVSSFSLGAAVTLGLYTDNGGGFSGGLPKTLIAQTNEVQITASNTWLYGNLKSPVALQVNTPYWVAIETNSVNKVLYWGYGGLEPACSISYSTTLPNTYPSCPAGLTSAYFYTVIVAGVTLTNGQSSRVPDGDYQVTANPASGYVFSSWSSLGSISLSSSSNPTTMVVSYGAGSLTANFDRVVTSTSTAASTSTSTTTTSSTQTFRTATTTTSTSTSTTTTGQVCYATSTTQTTSVIIQGTLTSGTTTSTTTTTTSSTSSLTTTSSTSTSTSITKTTATATVCTQTSTSISTSTTLTTFTRPSTTISLTSPSTVNLGDTVTLSGSIVPNPGTVQAVISLSPDSGSTWSVLMIVTTDSGSYSATWIPSYPGNYLLMSSWSGNDQLAGSTSSSASLTVTGAATPTPTLLLTSPATASRGQTVGLQITIFNPTSMPLNANVTIQITGTSNYVMFDVIQVKVTGNSQSTAYYDWTVPNSTGTYSVSAGLLPSEPSAFDKATIQVS